MMYDAPDIVCFISRNLLLKAPPFTGDFED